MLDSDVSSKPFSLSSTLCRYEHFLTDWYAKWSVMLGIASGRFQPEGPAWTLQRKDWEWAAIVQALSERDMLRPGRSGIGFAVGREPLPALFAALGAEVLATDQPAETVTATWSETGQHAASREALFHSHVCSREAFDARVRFEPLDMTRLDDLPRAAFDFAWSSCSFEHLGSLQAGLEFVLSSTELLRPGGVAVHTTEFNVSSDGHTAESGDDVIYRRRDLEDLDRQLRSRCAGLARLDLFAGDHPFDLTWDYPPYFQHGRPHLKLILHGHVTTSVLLIVQKGNPPEVPQIAASEVAPDSIVGASNSRAVLNELLDRVSAQDQQMESLRIELRSALDQQATATQELQTELDQARAMLNAVRQSTSWRLTAPLRVLRSALKGKD